MKLEQKLQSIRKGDYVTLTPNQFEKAKAMLWNNEGLILLGHREEGRNVVRAFIK